MRVTYLKHILTNYNYYYYWPVTYSYEECCNGGSNNICFRSRVVVSVEVELIAAALNYALRHATSSLLQCLVYVFIILSVQ